MLKQMKKKIFGSLKSKMISKKYGIIIKISKKEKVLYAYDLNNEIAIGMILKVVNSDLWIEIANHFNIKPFDYSIECADCDSKIKKRVVSLVGKEKQIREQLSQKARINLIKTLIKRDKEDEAIRQLLFAFRYLVDNLLALKKKGGAENTLQQIALKKWDEDYKIFHSDTTLINFTISKLLLTEYSDSITNRNINKEIKFLNKVCKNFHETIKQLYK